MGASEREALLDQGETTMTRLKSLILPAIGAAAIIIATVAPGQNGGGGIVAVDNIFPAARVIEIDDEVALFNTATGEIQKIRGQRTGPGATGNLFNFAQPVNGSTSGFLQIQRAKGGTFLVDLISGDIWILRVASENSASWRAIDN
jgi:hypothetical protein